MTKKGSTFYQGMASGFGKTILLAMIEDEIENQADISLQRQYHLLLQSNLTRSFHIIESKDIVHSKIDLFSKNSAENTLQIHAGTKKHIMSFYIEKEIGKTPPIYQLTVINRGAGARVKKSNILYPFYVVKGITNISALILLLLELKTKEPTLETMKNFYTQDLPLLSPSKEANPLGHLVVRQSKGTCTLSSPQQFSHLLAYLLQSRLEVSLSPEEITSKKEKLIDDMLDQLTRDDLIKILVKDVLEKVVLDKKEDAITIFTCLEIKDSQKILDLIKTDYPEDDIPLLLHNVTTHLADKSQEDVEILLKQALLEVPLSYLLYKGFGFSTPHLRRIVSAKLAGLNTEY